MLFPSSEKNRVGFYSGAVVYKYFSFDVLREKRILTNHARARLGWRGGARLIESLLALYVVSGYFVFVKKL